MLNRTSAYRAALRLLAAATVAGALAACETPTAPVSPQVKAVNAVGAPIANETAPEPVTRSGFTNPHG